jgi:23S rRNA-/tRNA-specific pseudouridylate synthase
MWGSAIFWATNNIHLLSAFSSIQAPPNTSRQHSLSLSTVSTPSAGGKDALLAEELKQEYLKSSTDGVAAFVPRLMDNDITGGSVTNNPQHLLSLAMEAGDYQSSRASSIVHGMMAGLILSQRYDANLQLFELLLHDNNNQLLEEDRTITIDLVTCALAYHACHTALNAGEKITREESATSSRTVRYERLAEVSLDTALKLAKKIGGSSQRKAITAHAKKMKSNAEAEPNNFTTPTFTDSQDMLLNKYGLEILHEDAQVICLNKPAGMVCYHTRKTTKGKRGEDASLEEALLKAMPSGPALSLVNPDARGLVHRIDRGTSGCIVMAKTNEAHLRLVAEFFMRQCKKSYLALVHGEVGGGEQQLAAAGVIELPIGSQPSRSRYEVQQVYQSTTSTSEDAAVNNNAVVTAPSTTCSSLVRVYTETGRKHQVRVHCASGLNCPIYLDSLYFPKGAKNAEKDSKSKTKTKSSNKKRRQAVKERGVVGGGTELILMDGTIVPPSIAAAGEGTEPGHRFFLHASTLQIPSFGIDVEAPLPSWWNEAMEGLEERP